MCAGSALRQEEFHRQEYRQEYRRCLEREFRQGRAGPCSDPSFGERLGQRLRREPAVLGALQEDALVLLARGLRDRPDPGPALRGLASAFRLLELAAINLYLFPWRKEFGTVQVRTKAVATLAGGRWMHRQGISSCTPAPPSPYRPSPACTCTHCARRSPKMTWCGASAGWAMNGVAGTVWPSPGRSPSPSWSPPPAASSPAGWSARSWRRW